MILAHLNDVIFMQCLVCEGIVSEAARNVLCLNLLVCNRRWLEVQEQNGWQCHITGRGESTRAWHRVCDCVLSKQKVIGPVDSVLPPLFPQILDGEQEKQCPLTWTPVSPVLTGCLSWESAACARGEKEELEEEEEEQGRRTREKTEGGRGETFYPLCLTPPLEALKGNPPTAMPP